jgi:two-component system, OmpR family, response regulator
LAVAKGRVLIIEHDEWEATLLTRFLSEAGYEVEVARSARQGFERTREIEPDCILCNVNLPDVDGYWVARRVRAEPSRVATTPFLFLIEAQDTESRLEGLNVGADLYLDKPFRNEEVVAQVSAMIEMANRLRQQRESFSEGPESEVGGAAIQGDLAQMSIVTVLTLLELERRTGMLKIRDDDSKTAVFELVEGAFARAMVDDEPSDVMPLLSDVVRWKKGNFSFRGGKVLPSTELKKIGGLLLEAMRLEDEAAR